MKFSRKKILVIGSSGMVGHMVTDYMSEKGHLVYDISRKKEIGSTTFNYDLRQYDRIFESITKESFDYVINCAAVLVRESETDRENAVFVNAYFPQILAKHCRNMRTKVVQLSTGGVFSGRDTIGFGNDVYYEKSLLSPPTFYGATKVAGEIINSKDLTVRTDFWGPDVNADGSGIFNWLMSQSGTVKGYDDIHFNGISNLEFCRFLDWLFENDLTGIVHVGAKDHISKGNLLRLLKETFLLDIDIESSVKMKSSVVLKNTFDIDYVARSYEEMCKDIQHYIKSHKSIYENYFFEGKAYGKN